MDLNEATKYYCGLTHVQFTYNNSMTVMEVPLLQNERLRRHFGQVRYYYSGACRSCCSLTSKSQPLQRCARCHLVAYCGKNCQRNDWEKHKIFCKTFQVKNGKNALIFEDETRKDQIKWDDAMQELINKAYAKYTTMTSNSSYLVQGEHDEVMTVQVNTKQPLQKTLTSDDPLLCSTQSQVATSFIKEKTRNKDIPLFSNQNEKDIDDLDDQELLKFLYTTEHIDHQTQPNVKSQQIDNNAQLKNTTKVNGTYDTQQQDTKNGNNSEGLAYYPIPSYSSNNAEVPQNQEKSAQTPTQVVLTPVSFAQIVKTKGISLQNPVQVVLTQADSTQIEEKQVTPCSDATEIVLSSGNATQLGQQQGIAVQNTMLLPTQSSLVYLYSDADGTTSLHDTRNQQLSNTKVYNKQVITRNVNKMCSPTQKRSHQEDEKEEEEEEEDDDEKSIEMKKKDKINNENTNKKMKKWEIEQELKDPIEEQKRLNAKKARDHRVKEKREKEDMKNKIKSLEELVKDLESNIRVLKAENNLLRSFKV